MEILGRLSFITSLGSALSQAEASTRPSRLSVGHLAYQAAVASLLLGVVACLLLALLPLCCARNNLLSESFRI